jgi:hypothetical protein
VSAPTPEGVPAVAGRPNVVLRLFPEAATAAASAQPIVTARPARGCGEGEGTAAAAPESCAKTSGAGETTM